MLSVMYPGWLLLLFCGIVLIMAGCAAFPTRVPPLQSATPYPPVTLTIFPFATESPQPRSTQPTISNLSLHQTPEWLINRVVSTSPPDDTPHLQYPTCYDNPNQQKVCLGQIWNLSQTAIENVTIHLTYPQDGINQQTHIHITTEQHHIPPQSYAPYRIWLPLEIEDNFHLQAEAIPANASQLSPVQIQGSRGSLSESGRYIITATLRNVSVKPTGTLRLITTLLDEEEDVIGYHVSLLSEPIAANAERIIRVEVMPLVPRRTLYHILYIEIQQTEIHKLGLYPF